TPHSPQELKGILKALGQFSYHRAAGIPTHFQELLFSYLLVFGCDKRSVEIGYSLINNDAFMAALLKFGKAHSAQKPYVYLQSYPVYGTRLQIVLHRINNW